MKTEEEVQKRLLKLRNRRLRQFCSSARAKKPENCVHNICHAPMPYSPSNAVETELEIAPRQVSTSIHTNKPQTIRLCVYGSENPGTWNGDICDSDDVALACNKFSHKVSEEEATAAFNATMADDEYVLKNHSDIAALQWVLETRVHSSPVSTWTKICILVDRFKVWLKSFSLKKEKPKELPELPEGIWEDDAK